jgi:outer membrane protein OmpA-like peptidoglycan-associated protein
MATITSVGCATKKFVRETVTPVQKRVDDLDKKTATQSGQIAELDKGVSRADERAQGADSRAGAAAREAARANEQAALSSKQATDAQGLAQKGIAQATTVERGLGTLGTRVESLDNYRQVSTESVTFKLGQSELSAEAKATLDGIAAKVTPMKRYQVQVEGFTDSTGDSAYNIELSRRRAAAVVRYLTLQGKIPLFRVHTVGYGDENPAGDNKTRDGRQQNRRVEVRVYAVE